MYALQLRQFVRSFIIFFGNIDEKIQLLPSKSVLKSIHMQAPIFLSGEIAEVLRQNPVAPRQHGAAERNASGDASPLTSSAGLEPCLASDHVKVSSCNCHLFLLLFSSLSTFITGTGYARTR